MRTPEDAPTDPDRMIRLGTIASVDLVAARCTVTLDTGVTTSRLRWQERRMGATRSWSPPSVGEQVLLLCPGGEIGAGIVLRGIASTAHPPPGSTVAELTEYADGAVVSYDPVAHALAVTLPAGATAAITAPGGITLTGPVNITGKVTITGDLAASGTITGATINGTGDVVAAGISGKGHKHGGVAAGSGVSAGPQ